MLYLYYFIICTDEKNCKNDNILHTHYELRISLSRFCLSVCLSVYLPVCVSVLTNLVAVISGFGTDETMFTELVKFNLWNMKSRHKKNHLDICLSFDLEVCCSLHIKVAN